MLCCDRKKPILHLPVLVHKLLVEVDNALHPLGTRSEERSAEVQGALLLTESAAGNDADARLVEELEAVKLVCVAALGLGGVDGALGQLDGGEEVHGALGLGALDALHLRESLVQGVGALAQAVVDAVVLLVVELVRGLARLGRVDHELDEALADDGGAEHDGDELVNVGLDLGIKADELKVAAAVAALADHALGDAVQRGELDGVELAVGVLLLHLAQDALEAVELADKDVGLVDLVGDNDEAALVGELDDGADVGLGERGARRVARVDDGNGPHVEALGDALFVRLADRVHVCAPVLGLVEVVGDRGGVDQRQRRRVQRVLRDRDHDARLLGAAEDAEEGVDAGRGAGREVDVGGVGGEAIALCKGRLLALDSFYLYDREKKITLNKLGNALLDGGHTGTGTVGADGADALEQELGALNDVGLVAQRVDEGLLVVEQARVLEDAEDLAEKGNGLLVELLGVANVGIDDLVKRQRLVALVEAGAEGLGLEGELAADGVLGVDDALVDLVDADLHVCGLGSHVCRGCRIARRGAEEAAAGGAASRRRAKKYVGLSPKIRVWRGRAVKVGARGLRAWSGRAEEGGKSQSCSTFPCGLEFSVAWRSGV